jgi:tRNA(fMet)-specific endonuclease VapC
VSCIVASPLYSYEGTNLLRSSAPSLLPVDLATARAHAHVWAELAATGKMIGPHNLWLAATCLAHGFTMVTANLREFARVPGLGVEVWGRPP